MRTSGKPNLGTQQSLDATSASPTTSALTAPTSVSTTASEQAIEVYTAPVSPASVMRSGGIRGTILQPRLQELGKIKIGRLGAERKAQSGKTYRIPEKLDHFVITRTDRDPNGDLTVDTDIMAALSNPRELDITLLSNDPNANLLTCMAYYVSRQCYCFGDGVTGWRAHTADDNGRKRILDGERFAVQCPCEHFDGEGATRCKVNGVLSVQLAKARVLGGVYRFRTTSIHSVSNMLSSMELIKVYTGGILAGLPLAMTLTPMTKDVSVKGQMQSTTFWVVGIVYKGDAESLQAAATQAAERRLQFSAGIAALEQKAQNLLSSAPITDTDAEVSDEFYPELEETSNG